MTGFERECTLVKYGKKFHPVKKYAVDLADMTPSNKQRHLGGHRKWYLKIEGLYRDFIEQDARIRNYQLSQEYTKTEEVVQTSSVFYYLVKRCTNL